MTMTMTASSPAWVWIVALAATLPTALACSDPGQDDDESGTETHSGDGDGDGDPGDGDPGDGDPGDGDPGDGDGDPSVSVSVSGDAFSFGPGTMVADATVTILELPGFETSTDADGHFELDALPAGSPATFVFDKPGYPRIYTKTFTLPAEDGAVLERVSFQAPDDATFGALAQIVGIAADPGACQLASTVTRVGVSLYDGVPHGEDGATVTLTPSLPAEHGPIYFNENVIPQADLVETSHDGGILYTNVPPGTYVLSASKDGVAFEDITIRCDADVLVNPSPPHGLQALP